MENKDYMVDMECRPPMPEPQDLLEKDVWNLDKLEIPIRENFIYRVKTLNFMKIEQEEIRKEVKAALFHQLQYKAVGTVSMGLTAFRTFSNYLREKQADVRSCKDIDGALIEDYMVFQMTKRSTYKSIANHFYMLRSVLETIGKLYGWPHLESLIMQSDIPHGIQPEFRAYSDGEMKRLNAQITKLEEPIARCLILHQMLGTRISDTLTLQQDCLFKQDGQDMIRIRRSGTDTYVKPVCMETARLIGQAIAYTRNRFSETTYVFVNEQDPSRPLQYATVKSKVRTLIRKEDIRDDRGELLRFNTRMFRHYYGVKLTELHLDSWTIAKLLGNKGVESGRYYQKMNNQVLADATRKARAEISGLIYENLKGWGEKYEQIR